MKALLKLMILVLATVLDVKGHTFQGFSSWAKRPCCARDISARNGEIFSRNNVDDKIYWWNGTINQDTVGAGFSVAASPDGWHWIVGGDNQLYRWNSTSFRMMIQPITGIKQVSAVSKDIVLVQKLDHTIAFCWSNGTCIPMQGTASWVGLGKNDERWMVGYPDNQIWRWNKANGNWDQMPGENAKRIDVLGPNAVAMVAQNNTVYLWEYGHWAPIQGSNCEYVTLDTGKMWCSLPAGDIYYGEFKYPYPAASTSGSNMPSPDMDGAMGSGQCEVIIECPYVPVAAPASCV